MLCAKYMDVRVPREAGAESGLTKSRKVKNRTIVHVRLVLTVPWTQPTQAKKNQGSEPLVRGKYHIAIFRVGLALVIFLAWGGNPAGTRPRVSFLLGNFFFRQVKKKLLAFGCENPIKKSNLAVKARRRRKKNSRATSVNQV